MLVSIHNLAFQCVPCFRRNREGRLEQANGGEIRSNSSEVDSTRLYLLTHAARCKDDGTLFLANGETASAGEPQVPEPVPGFHTSGIVGIPSMPGIC